MPALAGISRMPYHVFLAFNAAGGLVWGIGFTLLGYFAGNAYKRVESTAGTAAAIVVAVAVVAALVVWHLRRRRREAEQEQTRRGAPGRRPALIAPRAPTASPRPDRFERPAQNVRVRQQTPPRGFEPAPAEKPVGMRTSPLHSGSKTAGRRRRTTARRGRRHPAGPRRGRLRRRERRHGVHGVALLRPRRRPGPGAAAPTGRSRHHGPGGVRRAATSAPAGAAAPRAADSRCTVTELRMRLGAGSPGAGQVYYPLRFTNTSQHTCELNGFPGVSLLRGDGSVIGRPAAREGAAGGPVKLAPGATVEADLHTLDRGIKGDGCWRTPTLLKAYPPGSRDAMTLTTRSPVICGDTFDVGTVH